MTENIKNLIIGILCFILVGGYCYLVIREEHSKDYDTRTISEEAYNDCQDDVEKLESEISELKYKLDNINQMASDRDYNYNELLDDIEAESIY